MKSMNLKISMSSVGATFQGINIMKKKNFVAYGDQSLIVHNIIFFLNCWEMKIYMRKINSVFLDLMN